MLLISGPMSRRARDPGRSGPPRNVCTLCGDQRGPIEVIQEHLRRYQIRTIRLNQFYHLNQGPSNQLYP